MRVMRKPYNVLRVFAARSVRKGPVELSRFAPDRRVMEPQRRVMGGLSALGRLGQAPIATESQADWTGRMEGAGAPAESDVWNVDGGVGEGRRRGSGKPQGGARGSGGRRRK